jgi:hypothetical protein
MPILEPVSGQVGLRFLGKVISGRRDRTATTSAVAECENPETKATGRKGANTWVSRAVPAPSLEAFRLTPAEHWRSVNVRPPNSRWTKLAKRPRPPKTWLGLLLSDLRGGLNLADAATAPLPAATTATATAASPGATAAAAASATDADSTTATTAAAPTTAASTPSDLVTKLRLGALLVEDIEGRKADV